MVELFLIMQIVCLAAVTGLHAGRARFTLAPAFGGCSILTFITWQLLQTAWWVDFAGAHINAAIYGPMPAILAGLTLVYAMDGNRAARAYLLTMAVTAAVCLLFNEFLFQLAHLLPITSLFRFPLSMHSSWRRRCWAPVWSRSWYTSWRGGACRCRSRWRRRWWWAPSPS